MALLRFSASLLTSLVCLLAMAGASLGDDKRTRNQFEPSESRVYKQVGDVELKLHIFNPPRHRDIDRRGAIVFFFGGGWNGGTPSQFYPHCDHLARAGMVAISAEYRVKSRHGTSPFECVMDGKSAIRWVRKHHAELGIEPDHIAAGGGSAGGHVAAAVATVPGLDEPGEDPSVSCVPNALVLFNPVYDNGPEGYGYERVQDRYREISPLHNISEGMPPTIVFLGTKDKLVPVATAEAFRDKMLEAGSRSELILFEGAEHGFFNYGRDGNAYGQTVQKMEDFLRSLSYFGKRNGGQ
jgi:acetyl esterase/lipase